MNIENLPVGTKHLYGTLFAVPFAAIQVPEATEEDGDEYKFSNPRLLTERGQSDLMDKRVSTELRDSIKTNTLLNPLVCRWVENDDGKLFPQLVGGDRRYRAVDFLIRKKETVTDPRSIHMGEDGQWQYKQVSADEAYATIPCQIFATSNDLDALALSWAENKNRIDLTEGHEIAEIIKLRKVGANDEKILEILQHDEKWLAESDRLIDELDDNTLDDLLESRMNRACAIELSSIEDEELREKVRIRANESALESAKKKIKRFQKQIDLALDEREIAEGAVAEAEFNYDDAGLEVAAAQVVAADKKVKRSAQERDDTASVATSKNVREAKAEIQEESGETPVPAVPAVPKMLKLSKIKECVEYLDALILSNGKCLEETFVADVDELKLVRRILTANIMANDSNFAETIQQHVESKTR